MKVSLVAFLAITFTLLSLPGFQASYEPGSNLKSAGAPEWLAIEGLVENPLNLSYAELRDFPLISEVADLQCVGDGTGGPSVTYNWTGVPLFYLLTMAKVTAGSYRKVAFNSTDDFSSSIMLGVAMHPTTILALEANGTDLEQLTGFGSGYRIVLPCRWGYKWVKWVKQITVVDYDYKGTYESKGLSDEAIRPNYTMPQTRPPYQTFIANKTTEHTVLALNNSTIESFNCEMDNRLVFNLSELAASGYFYVTFPKDLLTTPCQVYINQNPIIYNRTDSENTTHIYFTYTSARTITIEGVSSGRNPGDINADGAVDSTDLGILGTSWTAIEGEPNFIPDADINKDDVVDSSDLGIMGIHWGEAAS